MGLDNFREVIDTQTLRVHPFAMSLPCNPSSKDQHSERDGDCGEEPPLSADGEQFYTVLVGRCVEEYHTKEGLHSWFIRFAI